MTSPHANKYVVWHPSEHRPWVSHGSLDHAINSARILAKATKLKVSVFKKKTEDPILNVDLGYHDGSDFKFTDSSKKMHESGGCPIHGRQGRNRMRKYTNLTSVRIQRKYQKNRMKKYFRSRLRKYFGPLFKHSTLKYRRGIGFGRKSR